MKPRFPIYVVSKGRAQVRLTSRALERLELPYHIVVEEQEREQYAAEIDPQKVLVLDKRYQRDYDTFDTLGDSKSKGPGPARNFVWDHAIASGAPWHWVMDDNIRGFYRLHENQKVPADGTVLRCMEDFVLQFENVAMAGPNYYMFAPRKVKIRNPFVFNTRIYSCNLIRNDLPYRWRGRYNEDTDLSLRMLKAGWCTIQFNAFLQWKEWTQTHRGGNTDEFYAKEGTLPKSQMMVAMHPDVAILKWKFHRWHHEVDYSRFAKNILVKRKDAQPVPDYGFHVEKKYSGVRRSLPFAPKAKASSVRDRASLPLQHKLVQGGDVPGGHHAIFVGDREPYVPSMRECNSIKLRPSDVVIDIGAYVGTFAIRAARFPVKKVIAYEPTPKSFEVMSLTQLPNLELRQMAVVGDDRREVEFFIGQGYGPTNSIFVSRNRKRVPIKVPAIHYAEAVKGATVVKLDVEGAEHDLPVVQPGVRAYIIDFHKTRPDWLESSFKIIAQLEAAGFHAVIQPKWTSGLDRAGSWERDLPDAGGQCDVLMYGLRCCGCGAELQPTGVKSVCIECWPLWSKKHRAGFLQADKKKPAPSGAGESAPESSGASDVGRIVPPQVDAGRVRAKRKRPSPMRGETKRRVVDLEGAG